MGGNIGFPEGFGDGAEGGFVGAAGLFEAGEVVGPQEVGAGGVHGVEIQVRETALPGEGGHERVFLPVDEIGIGTLRGAEAGVEIVGCRKYPVDHDKTG